MRSKFADLSGAQAQDLNRVLFAAVRKRGQPEDELRAACRLPVTFFRHAHSNEWCAVTEKNLLSVSRYLGIEDEVQEILDDPVLRIQKQKVEQIIELVSHTDSMTPGEILEKVKEIVDYQ